MVALFQLKKDSFCLINKFFGLFKTQQTTSRDQCGLLGLIEHHMAKTKEASKQFSYKINRASWSCNRSSF